MPSWVNGTGEHWPPLRFAILQLFLVNAQTALVFVGARIARPNGLRFRNRSWLPRIAAFVVAVLRCPRGSTARAATGRPYGLQFCNRLRSTHRRPSYSQGRALRARMVCGSAIVQVNALTIFASLCPQQKDRPLRGGLYCFYQRFGFLLLSKILAGHVADGAVIQGYLYP